jgi:NAD(P)-dependent dehydrogenase (short-subunit alcohol dehydrogenase family)
MLAWDKGSIISIGSIAEMSSLGREQSVQRIAMAAVIPMTRELSTEWADRGMRVNCIMPAQVLNRGLSQRMETDPVPAAMNKRVQS